MRRHPGNLYAGRRRGFLHSRGVQLAVISFDGFECKASPAIDHSEFCQGF